MVIFVSTVTCSIEWYVNGWNLSSTRSLHMFHLTLEISSTEWNHLVQLHQILQVFFHAAKIMSGSKYPSIGCAYFVLAKLRLFLSNDVADNAVARRIKKLLLAKYIQYFEDDRQQLNLLKVSAKTSYRNRLLY